jgi:hypothetical protein
LYPTVGGSMIDQLSLWEVETPILPPTEGTPVPDFPSAPDDDNGDEEDE